MAKNHKKESVIFQNKSVLGAPSMDSQESHMSIKEIILQNISKPIMSETSNFVGHLDPYETQIGM